MGIGIIGTGWGTRVQVPAFRAAGLEIRALAARSITKTQQQARELGIPFATDDWRAMLARDDVELVSIVTPPHTHRAIALAALAAGKHVLCEKPMALDAAETQTMVEAAGARPQQLALIDHELRFVPTFQTFRQRVQEGAFGALRHVEVNVSGSSRADPARRWNWWSDVEQGGGLLGAIGSHQIDTLQFLFGPITAVSAVLHTFITERPSDAGPRAVTADDYAALHLRLAAGSLAVVTMSVVAGVNQPNQLTAHFEHGALRLRGGRLLAARRGSDFEDISPAHTVAIPDGLTGSEFEQGTVYLGHALKRALAGDGTALAPAATFQDGHRIQRLLDAARQSHALGSGWMRIEA